MVMIIIMIIIIIVITRAAPVQGAASCPHGCSKGGSEGDGDATTDEVCASTARAHRWREFGSTTDEVCASTARANRSLWREFGSTTNAVCASTTRGAAVGDSQRVAEARSSEAGTETGAGNAGGSFGSRA